MNYERIYNQIIERAKTRTLKGYGETHHIIPKCLNGTNHPENMVRLTAREHFLAHWLLHEIYPNNSDLRYAFWCMFRNSIGQERYVPSSRVYEYAKIKMIEVWHKIKKTPAGIESIKKRLTGTKWYHTLGGFNFRVFADDPRILTEGWIPGRFDGKHISKHANNIKEIQYAEGKQRPETSNKKCSIDGKVFKSASEAAKELGMNQYTLRWILQGRFSPKQKEKYKNWYYIINKNI